MHVRVDRNDAQLVEPEDLTSFSVECGADLSEAEFVDCVNRFALGDVLPGGAHVMVAVETVVRMANDRVGPGWWDDFGQMLAFAADHGWTSADGSHVRAHVVRR